MVHRTRCGMPSRAAVREAEKSSPTLSGTAHGRAKAKRAKVADSISLNEEASGPGQVRAK